ncbi:MAG: thioredoxin domain-containing protein [Pyrinomonadaceae bacterium]|nr:thioredoxin domain-containing protein [Pyrinomonadaceae bacterium]
MADKTKPQPKSNAPMLIIGLVLIVGAVAGWYLLTKPKSPTPANNSNTAAANSNSSSPKAQTIPANAPPGANPPNQAGSPNALVTVEEFADFQCGSCASVHPVMNEIKAYYGSKIRFVFRNFPLPMHDKAYDAAVAAEAAGNQGKFWDMQNLLFSNQKAWASSASYKTMWKEYAQKIGLDVPKWENDMISTMTKSRVDADIARGKGVNINATPTLYINGVPFQFAEMQASALKAAIDAELAKVTQGGNSNAPANAAPANTNAAAPKP